MTKFKQTTTLTNITTGEIQEGIVYNDKGDLTGGARNYSDTMSIAAQLLTPALQVNFLSDGTCTSQAVGVGASPPALADWVETGGGWVGGASYTMSTPVLTVTVGSTSIENAPSSGVISSTKAFAAASLSLTGNSFTRTWTFNITDSKPVPNVVAYSVTLDLTMVA